MTWKVDTASYESDEYLAIDEFLTKKAAETGQKYLRVGGFESDVFLPAWRTSLKDIEKSIDDGCNFSRRLTDGSTIYCGDNSLQYSIILPTEELPTKVFKQELAPVLTDIINSFGVENSEIDEIYNGIRVGDHPTPSEHPDGLQISGNAIRRENHSVLCEGIITINPWDLPELFELRSHEGIDEVDFVEQLPYLADYSDQESTKSDLARTIVGEFTNGDYTELQLSESDWQKVDEISNEKYGNFEWLQDPGYDLEENQGFCMVDISENGFY